MYSVNSRNLLKGGGAMDLFRTVRKWTGYKWFEILSIIVKSLLALAVIGTFLFFSIMVYLLIQDFFYDEDDFNDNGSGNLIVSEFRLY